MKKEVILSLLLISIILTIGISGCEETATSNTGKGETGTVYPQFLGDELQINSYSFDHTEYSASHICNGITESLSFDYNQTEFSIKYLQLSKGGQWDMYHNDYPVSDFSICESNGIAMNIYQKETNNCIITSNTTQPINTKWGCSSILKIRILDMNNFDNCLNQQNCTFINGEEVLVLN